MKHKWVVIFLKGIGIGAANVIPGVSGGTIALITGIYEELIHSLKSFNLTALKFILKGDIKGFAKYVNLNFLIAVFLGVVVSILFIAKILDYLFINYPVYIWAYFFGLIMASVFFVGKTISRWSVIILILFVVGAIVAGGIAILPIAAENNSFLYLLLCGIVAVCSMILPGLSGSFVLILMGNYKLLMIDSINHFDFMILLPFFIGIIIGLLGFSYLLSWIFGHYRDQTIALLTGFIFGSLAILWPWKHEITATFGNQVKIVGYERFIPEHFDTQVLLVIVYAILGIVSIWIIEKLATK